MFRSFFAPRNVSNTAPEAADDVASPKEKDGAASNRAEVVASPETQRKDKAVANHIQKMDTKIRYELQAETTVHQRCERCLTQAVVGLDIGNIQDDRVREHHAEQSSESARRELVPRCHHVLNTHTADT